MTYMLVGSCTYEITLQSEQYAVVVQLMDGVEHAALTAMARKDWGTNNPTYAQIAGACVRMYMHL